MLFTPRERKYVELHKHFLYANPLYHPNYEAWMQEVVEFDLGLGEQEAKRPPFTSDYKSQAAPIARRDEALLELLAERMAKRTPEATPEEIRWYGDLMVMAIYYRHFGDVANLGSIDEAPQKASGYRAFLQDCERYCRVPLKLEPFAYNWPHIYAVYAQVRRAIELIPELVQGNSRPIKELRAAIWHSIFPHELRLYGELLYNRMHDVTTLILGPSGTGKELVATAIGLSRYIPFDDKKQRLTESFRGAFHAVNLSAMPRDLIESEMFGHTAGAYTGAIKARAGWFEVCRPGHAVFLDEIGELDESVQVKLLRVLQNREFYRVGENEPRRFTGKIIAATNRDLDLEIEAGRFREDLFYRLCSDVIRTPSLREQLNDCPDDLPYLVRLVAERCLGAHADAEHLEWLTDLAVRWIVQTPELGEGYSWPGNFRELEQCVRNVMIRGAYHPQRKTVAPKPSATTTASTISQSTLDPLDRFVGQVRHGELTMDELLEQYCSLIFARSGNLAETARRLDKHRATIQHRIRKELVQSFKKSE